MYDELGLDSHPIGINAVVAVITYTARGHSYLCAGSTIGDFETLLALTASGVAADVLTLTLPPNRVWPPTRATTWKTP